MKNKLQKASKNIIYCLNIKKNDRVLLIIDEETESISVSLQEALNRLCMNVLIIHLEKDIGVRPFQTLSKDLINLINNFKPNVSIYFASGKEGELQVFRSPLMKLLTRDLRCRHAHMIGIDKKLMESGMSADYEKIYKQTMKVFNLVKKAKEIRVVADNTDLIGEFSSKMRWKPCHGRIWKKGLWSNLPEGEVFTCPKSVNGYIEAWIVGDYFSKKYGVLKSPLNIEIKDSFITKINSKNNKLEKEFEKYIKTYKNGNRVGEFAIGTLVNLKKFTGNLLQDEKYPGLHIAFGWPYGDDTGAKWKCPTHVDVIPKNCTIYVDGKMIMKNSKFLI